MEMDSTAEGLQDMDAQAVTSPLHIGGMVFEDRYAAEMPLLFSLLAGLHICAASWAAFQAAQHSGAAFRALDCLAAGEKQTQQCRVKGPPMKP